MTNDYTVPDLCELLGRSERGRSAMRHLLEWFDDDGLGLDLENEVAVVLLIQMAFGSYSMSVRDEMRKYVQPSDVDRLKDENEAMERIIRELATKYKIAAKSFVDVEADASKGDASDTLLGIVLQAKRFLAMRGRQ